MSETTVSTDSGPLSVDQAVESLLAPAQSEEHEEAAPAEAAAEPEIEGEPTPEEPTDQAETPEEEGEAEEAAPAVALEPPKYWGQEAKARFAELPPELQAVVLEQEGPREEAAAKAKQEAAKVRQEADHQVAQVQQIVVGLNELVPKALETFKSRWDGIDWIATIKEHGPEQAAIWKAEMEAEQAQLSQLHAARAEAEQVARQAFVKAEMAKLQGTELEAPEARNEVAKYLLSEGYEASDVERVSADDLKIARKAMLWDRAQAALKAKPPAPKPVAPVRQAVRPAAAAQSSTEQRNATQIANRYAQTRSVDDAVALLLAQGSRK